jgi:uncharacterized protein YpmB
VTTRLALVERQRKSLLFVVIVIFVLCCVLLGTLAYLFHRAQSPTFDDPVKVRSAYRVNITKYDFGWEA